MSFQEGEMRGGREKKSGVKSSLPGPEEEQDQGTWEQTEQAGRKGRGSQREAGDWVK